MVTISLQNEFFIYNRIPYHGFLGYSISHKYSGSLISSQTLKEKPLKLKSMPDERLTSEEQYTFAKKEPMYLSEYRGFKVCLAPVAGLTRNILWMFLGVLPRRCAAPASKLLSQFVEPGCRFSPTLGYKQKHPPKKVGVVIWYQWPDSNRHAFKGGGF